MQKPRRDKSISSRWRRRLRGQRGQSMVSYALITAAIMGILGVTGIYFIPKMLDAYDIYAQSTYFGVNMPLP